LARDRAIEITGEFEKRPNFFQTFSKDFLGPLMGFQRVKGQKAWKCVFSGKTSFPPASQTSFRVSAMPALARDEPPEARRRSKRMRRKSWNVQKIFL
jgi:hypothetical protein